MFDVHLVWTKSSATNTSNTTCRMPIVVVWVLCQAATGQLLSTALAHRLWVVIQRYCCVLVLHQEASLLVLYHRFTQLLQEDCDVTVKSRTKQAGLHTAKRNKNDEFYTQLEDVEKELVFYAPLLKNKVVYCNCDDYKTSMFFKFFKEHFESLGLRELICSNYVAGERGTWFVKTRRTEKRGKFTGDGDFRSAESLELLQRADMVITNPPFSLFREFVNLVVANSKQFLIIGNINCLTYKDIFGLIAANTAWLGIHMGRGISGFIVPKTTKLYGTECEEDAHGNNIIRTNNCLWLTNLLHEQRKRRLPLTCTYKHNEHLYPKFTNYQGINVDKTSAIPSDFKGTMGVPITFLHKYNPRQFKIVGFRKGNDGKDLALKDRKPYFRVLIKKH